MEIGCPYPTGYVLSFYIASCQRIPAYTCPVVLFIARRSKPAPVSFLMTGVTEGDKVTGQVIVGVLVKVVDHRCRRYYPLAVMAQRVFSKLPSPNLNPLTVISA